MRFVVVALLASGCVPISHEQIVDRDSDGDGVSDSDEWVDIVGAEMQALNRVAFADLDGDGLDDIIVGSPTTSDAPGMRWRRGAISIVYGRSTRPSSPFELRGGDLELEGPLESHPSGRALMIVGFSAADFDGDAIDDLAVTVGDVSDWTSPSTLYVLYGTRERVFGRQPVEDLPLVTTGAFRTPESPGDLDDDGYEELGLWSESTTFLVRGGPDGLPAAPLDAYATFARITPQEFMGALASGDLDGDGVLDLVVRDALLPVPAVRANVFYGPIAPGAYELANADASIVIPNGRQWWGALSGFDLDDDGMDELFLSAGWPGDSRVFLVRGSAARLEGSSVASDVASVTLVGAHSSDAFGESASAGDFDGDGRPELLVGSSSFTRGEESVGRAYRFSGPLAVEAHAEEADEIFEGRVMPLPSEYGSGRTAYAERLGATVAQNGDFDGDGYADALMTALADRSDRGNHMRLVFGGPPAE